jgi:integrase
MKGHGTISARTAARYRELVENQIAPHIGNKPLQKLRSFDIDAWHAALRTSGRLDGKSGIAARTIGHAHRILSKALSEASGNDLVTKNVAKGRAVPKPADDEMIIVQDVPALVAKLGNQNDRLRVVAMVSLFTGMRLAEVLALRWSRADIDKAIIQVRESLENTKAHGIRFKSPKSKAGRRDITVPDILLGVLREYRKAQLELRMKMGAGRRCPALRRRERQPNRPQYAKQGLGVFRGA